MAKVDILFGNPSSDKEWEFIEDHSDSTNSNIETSVISNFRILLENLFTKNKHGENYFELLICCIDGDSIKLPKMTVGTHKNNGFLFPKLTIHGDYGIDRDTNNQVFISDLFIDAIGKECELEYSYVYFGFKRIGKISPKTNEIIYLLGGKEHIFHDGRFLPALKTKLLGSSLLKKDLSNV